MIQLMCLRIIDDGDESKLESLGFRQKGRFWVGDSFDKFFCIAFRFNLLGRKAIFAFPSYGIYFWPIEIGISAWFMRDNVLASGLFFFCGSFCLSNFRLVNADMRKRWR